MQFFNEGNPLDKLLHDVSYPPVMDETKIVPMLINAIRSVPVGSPDTLQQARTLIEHSRKAQPESAINSLLQHYDLQTEEGLAVMCLAEALLRIPDSDSINELIHDKLSNIHWKEESTHEESWFLQGTDVALKLAGYLSDTHAKNYVKRAASILSEPIIRTATKHAMRLMGSQFVLGETIIHAMEEARDYPDYLFSYDTLGEGARSSKQSEHYFNSYLAAIEAVGSKVDKTKPLLLRDGVSVKLSALFPRYQLTKYERVIEELVPRLRTIIEHAHHYGIPLTIDAEEMFRLDISLMVFKELVLQGKEEGIGLAVQAYHKKTPYVLDFIIGLARETGRKIPVRLVKGAYWDFEIKHAQIYGLPYYPVFTKKAYTDISYLACAKKMAENMDVLYPQFATHNAYTIAVILQMMKGKPKESFEFQRLHGMGKRIYDQLVKDYHCRVYAPVGSHKELLPYLIRRLLENGANSSFVHHLSATNEPVDALLHNPVEIAGYYTKPFPTPAEIYGDARKNSSGVDMGNAHAVSQLEQSVRAFDTKAWESTPLLAEKFSFKELPTLACRSPHQQSKVIGTITYATEEHCKKAIHHAEVAYEKWNRTPAEKRAIILERIADLLEEYQSEAFALCIHEAGKTIQNAIGEVREAVDFCRYYAAEGRKLFGEPNNLMGPTGEKNHLSLHGRGVFICISPWNFPLAIFIGQITAALMAGNSVIAKPAEQTSLIAHFMVNLMHKAGIPRDVVQLLPGTGEEIGARLVSDPRIAGVVFTGSTEVAKIINRTLAAKDGPIATLIAETGGQNCMIADSSCLPEQLVDDVITSAFDSSGQRCSALRVLYVQEDIADNVIEILTGAMAELTIGNPSSFTTDIGAVIDMEAKKGLEQHIASMKEEATLLYHSPLPPHAEEGYFITPHVFEIKSIKQLSREVFGPILHIIRYPANKLDSVIADINSTGYGLTCGIHSRINERIDHICENIKAGNVYINRSIIGATVGVQPFGGQGLSGTGPKAGGPHYLARFAHERTLTNNIAAIGGNVELLS